MVLVSKATAPWHYAVVLLAIVATALGSYFMLRGAVVVERRLGQTGMNVLQRVMGLILAATAVQFVVDGIGAVMPTLVTGPKA
jgi:multiple antibiotic resistance protein